MPELTIVSFNTHAGLRPRHNGVCEPYDLAAAVRGFDADVIVLQESWTPDGGSAVAREVGAELGAAVFELPFGRARVQPWPHVPRSSDGDGTIGLAVVSRLPARERGRLGVGRVPLDPTPERGGLHLALDVGDTTVHLVAVHLSSRLPLGPPIQLTRLRGQLPPAAEPTIVAGDCNFWGPAVEAFLPGWRRAVRGRTWPAHRPHSQIDHVLVRGGLQVVAAEILPEVGSDHRPVRAVLRLE